jgi:hypothetical protein
MGGHRPSHVAKANESDVRHHDYLKKSAKRLDGPPDRLCVYCIVGMTKLAPPFTPLGQRDVTVLVLV